MKRLKRITALLISTLLLCSTFIGCSKKEEDKNKNSIVIWANLLDSEVAEYQKIADKWSKKSGVPVAIYSTSSTGTDFIETSDIKKPDIFFGVSAEDTGRLVKAKSVKKIPQELFPKEDYISDNLVDAASIDNVQYGIPITQESVVLYYNKDKVKKVPETMEELLQDAKKKGFAFQATDYYFSFGFAASQGGYLYKYENGTFNSKDIGVNNEGAIEGYKFLQDMFKENDDIIPGITDYLASDKFYASQVAYYIGESGRVRTFNKGGLNFGVTCIPSVNGKEVTPCKYVKMAVVSSHSKKYEKAFELLTYFMDQSDEIFMKTGPYAPTFKKSLESNTYKNSPYLPTLLEECNRSIVLPNTIENEALDSVMGGYLEDLVMNKITPEQCGKKMEKGIKERIDKVLTYDN